MNTIKSTLILFILLSSTISYSQYEDYNTVKAKVDFNTIINEWDGFGVNYVQTAHTKDYDEWAQEYGGFSLLSESYKKEIIDMIFGEDGLKPGIVKMFLDPLHQEEPGGAFDHETTTKYMREFVKMGVEKTRARGKDLEIVTTLYGPPAWATKQKTLRGRDLDHDYKEELALYMIDWARYLQDNDFPIKYISLHNEGEDWRRWAADGEYANFDHGHDYNLYWRPEEVADFIAFMPDLMEQEGLKGVSVTPGETSRFYQFDYSGYARAIYNNKKALDNIGLITSHNFYRNVKGGHRWWCGSNNHGTYLLQSERPDLKSWVTSASWGGDKTTVDFVWQIYMNLYQARVNGYMPWACIQRPPHWPGGDPNPATAFNVREDGTYEVLPGYYYYKQVTRAGQPGMGVALVENMDSEVSLIGFAKNGTDNSDAFIVINNGISVSWRADNVEFFINDEKFRFLTKDQMYNRDNYTDVKAFAATSEDGYILEAAIPWNKVNITPEDDRTFDFNLVLTEGAYSVAGKMQWNGEGKLKLAAKEVNNDNMVTIKQIDNAPEIDGKIDAVWDGLKSINVEDNIHENTPDNYGGSWKAYYDKENLYVMVKVKDETNLQGRRLAIDLPGTDHKSFRAVRTSEDGELYEEIGTYQVEDGQIIYEAPSKTITTFFGE